MGLFSGILGGVAGLCAAFGVVMILGLMEPVQKGLDWQFWFAISVILFLAVIAINTARGGGGRGD